MKTLKRLLLMLCLIVAGVQSAWAKEAYAVINIETDVMTFYYNDDRSTHESNQNEAVYSLNTGSNRPDWWNPDQNYAFHVREVVFDRSFAWARPTSTCGWFGGMTLLTSVTCYGSYGSDHFVTLNTSEVTDMSGMFSNCQSLTYLDLSFIDTSKVTDMSSMFKWCSGLNTLSVNNFNTENVTNMSSMFEGCSSLPSLDVKNWNTASVTDMSYMFRYCSALTGLDLNNWNTANVTDMREMFNGCSSFSGLNLRDWNTANVTLMNGMFKDCSSLTSLNVKNWNTASVTNMSSMFSGCMDLCFVNDIKNWNTSRVYNMSSMFESCSSFITLDLSNWNTSRVYDMSSMFKNCSSLETIYVGSNWTVQGVSSYNEMFTNCTSLVGGRGTACEGKPYTIYLPYAHIDSPGSPGYLSDHSQEHMNLVLTAGACDKGIEVWNGDVQLCSISQDGGTVFEPIDAGISLELRVPNQYLEKITLNGEDVTTSLPSTTSDYPNYEDYTFYTLSDLNGVAIIDVKYNYPVLYEASNLTFGIMGGPGTASGTITYDDGTSESFDMSHNGEGETIKNIDWGHLEGSGGITHWVAEKRFIKTLSVTTRPQYDLPVTWPFLIGNSSTPVTTTDNGDGSHTYVVDGKDMKSNYIRMCYSEEIATNTYHTVGRVDGNFNVKYTFAIMYSADQIVKYYDTPDSYISGTVTVAHPGYADEVYCQGEIQIYTTQGNKNFRLIFDGEDVTDDCIWADGQTLYAEYCWCNNTSVGPQAYYYYKIPNNKMDKDSYFIVDDGSTPLNQVESPLQVQQRLSVIGVGTLSLQNSNGNVVGSVNDNGTATYSWPKGDALKLRATAPEGSDLTNAQAHLFLDDGHNLMTKTTDAQGNTYFEYTLNEVTLAHSFTLVFSGLETPEIIDFADANVKAICVANWDTDHDGELSKKEAAAVTTLLKDGSSVFKNKTALNSFDEFQYFTGLTTVEDEAFLSCGIKSIVLPSTINTIGVNAFMTSKLQHIDIPEGVTTIGNNAFYGSMNLETISLPRSLTKIGNGILGYTAIRHLFIPEMLNTIPVGNSQFIGCYKLSSVVVDTKNTVYNSRDNCSAILSGNAIYSGCNNTVIPEGVTSIQNNAFFCVGLKNLVIPASVNSIGSGAFKLNNMETLVMKRETPIAFNADRFTPDSIANCVLVVPHGKKTAYADYGWKSIADGGYFKEVVEEEKEIEIVTLPDNIDFADSNVKAICVGAGWDTDGDGEISKEEAAAVTTLKKNSQSVFYMNKTITHFDEFQYFTGLTEIEASAFYGTSLQSIVLPPNITSLGNGAFNSNQIRSIVIPEGVTSLGNHVFTDCSQLEEVKLPKSLTTIGYDVFANTAIKHIFIPENVTSITPGAGSNIFYNCPNLASVAVDENNPNYDSRDNCMAIIEKPSKFLYGCKNSMIPEGITELWSRAFHAANITSLVIPASVSTIRSGAFLENNLETLEMKRETPIQFSTDMFSSGMTETANCVLIVPRGKKTAYANAGWKSTAEGGCFKEVVEADDTDRYDVNRDGHITIADVTTLVNRILGKE